MRKRRKKSRMAALALGLALGGCQRAPSFDLLGSFFPVWIFCVAAGIIAAVVFRQVLIRLKYDSEVGPAIVIYPCFAALVAFLSWLVFFR